MDIPITQNEKIKFDSDSQMNISIEESIAPSSPRMSIQSTLEDLSSIDDKFDIPPMIVDLLSIDIPRERTMSESSSDTVDYDFDVQTTVSLTTESP